MKIDLHCHTKKIKSGDAETRTVTPELFKIKIENADVKIVAITNHNHFDLAQYEVLKSIVNGICQVWPGVELDIIGGSGKKGHLIVIANPNNVREFSIALNTLIGNSNVEDVQFGLTKIYEALDTLDVIYIFHFHKKPYVDDNDIEELKKLVNDHSRIFSETADNRSLGVFANHGYNVMIGSDVVAWDTYEGCTFAELRLPVTSFNQFCKLSLRDDTIINTLLNQKQSYQLIAHPHRDVNLTLKIYSDINIIFGQKGTGKSEILKSMHDSLVQQGLNCQLYVGNNRDSAFSDYLRTDDMDRDLQKVGISDCRADFNYLFTCSDKNPALISDYINWYNTKDHNKNKSRMKLTEARTIAQSTNSQYQTYKSAKKCSDEILCNISKINLKEFMAEDAETKLLEFLQQLRNSIYSKFIKEIIDKEATALSNFSINQIKAIADKNSNTKSKPSNTGFIDFAEKRLRIKECVTKIINNISDKEFSECNIIGNLENKGAIFVRYQYRMLCGLSKTNEFGVGIRSLREIKDQLIYIQANWFDNEIFSALLHLKDACNAFNINSAEFFLGLSKQIVTEDKLEYKPSSGEKSILLLQNVLKSDADAYFLDEPELGMGNSYIDSTIRPQLTALAKQRKVVVVATHNANIAVRTLPYISIFRTHENGRYYTYIGNPFNDQLVNMADSNDIKSWTFESMHTLEGGRSAFYERKDIYESGSN